MSVDDSGIKNWDEMGEETCTVPSWLTADFLQTALRKGDGNPNLTVNQYKINPATAKGDNFLSILYRAAVTITVDGVETQRSLIIKCFPVGEQQEIYIKQASLFDNEINMYTKTLPEMYRVLKEKYPDFKPFTPNFLYSDSKGEVVVMEDLLGSGYKMAKRQEGLDLQHCTLILKSLAMFHAASVVVRDKDPSSMDLYNEGLFKVSTREFLETYFTSSINSLLDEIQHWPGFKERYTGKLTNLIETCWDKISKAVGYDENSFNVLNHGDLWINNAMFRYSEENKLEHAMFIDLQNTHFTSPAVDLIYFLYTSPSENASQNHYDDLIGIYYQKLCSTLADLGYKHKAPKMEDILKELKRRMSLALFAIICELPNMLAEPDEGFDIGEYFSENEQPKNKTYSGEKYKKVVQRFLPLFDSCGIL